MTGILKISEASRLGLHAVLLLSRGPGEPITTNEAAESLAASAAHLSKVFQSLAKVGIVKAVRGPNGGYLLNKPLTEVRLRDVWEATEGPLKLSRCLLSEPRCGGAGCMFGGLLDSINQQVLQNFERRLSEL